MSYLGFTTLPPVQLGVEIHRTGSLTFTRSSMKGRSKDTEIRDPHWDSRERPE